MSVRAKMSTQSAAGHPPQSKCRWLTMLGKHARPAVAPLRSSATAAAAAAIRLAEQDAYAGKTIVVVLPDLAERYLSSVMFADVPTGIIEQPVAV